jgi:hypothetical protein
LTLFSEADVPFESKGPGAIRGLYLFYRWEFPSSEPVARPPASSHARETANSQRAARYSKIFVLARAVLEAALPAEDVLVELLDQGRYPRPAKAQELFQGRSVIQTA